MHGGGFRVLCCQSVMLNVMNEERYKGEAGLTAAQAGTRRQQVMRLLTHVICIGLLFVFPEMLNFTGSHFRMVPELKWGVYAKSLICISVFYLNYFILIPRALRSRNAAWRLVLYNLVVVAVALGLIWLVNEWMQPYWEEAWRLRHPRRAAQGGARPQPDNFSLMVLKFLSREAVLLILTIGLSVALKLSDSWMSISRRAEQLEDYRRRDELRNLKSQLNPHFLFNTLNSIYALIAISQPKAQEAVHELSGMLRYVLYDDRREVELEREFDFVKNYVKLMRLRLPTDAKLECSIDPGGCGRRQIAPLLFIPLIENLFKHGKTRGADLKISLTAADGTVKCITDNPVADHAADSQCGGIGLQNLRRRLQLIYGDKASLLTGEADGRFHAELTISLD